MISQDRNLFFSGSHITMKIQPWNGELPHWTNFFLVPNFPLSSQTVLLSEHSISDNYSLQKSFFCHQAASNRRPSPHRGTWPDKLNSPRQFSFLVQPQRKLTPSGEESSRQFPGASGVRFSQPRSSRVSIRANRRLRASWLRFLGPVWWYSVGNRLILTKAILEMPPFEKSDHNERFQITEMILISPNKPHISIHPVRWDN